jgi:ech hydrogenase subunit A
MDINLILFIALVIAPIFFGIAAYLSPVAWGRNLAILSCSVVVAAAGVALAFLPDFAIKSSALSGYFATGFEILIIGVILFIALRLKNWWIILFSVAQLAMVGAELTLIFTGHEIEHHANDFTADSLTKILVLITTLIGPVIAIYAISYMKKHQEHAPKTAASLGQFFFFFIAFLGFMNGLVMADNMKWFSFFWEATTLCSFMLIGQDGGESKKNALRALLINSFGGTALIAGGLWVLAYNNTESIEGLMAAKAVIPMVLLCVAAFTKSALLPFQSWLLGAMIAPTPVSALLHSATMVKAGAYLVLRLSPGFYGEKVMFVIIVFGALTFAGAALLAVTQSNSKRVLAYSTISNLGLVVACAGINSPLAYSAALAIICFHAVSKGLLFLCVGTIEQKLGSRDIEDMGGILFRMPITASVALIGMMSMLLPPFGMLLSKWMAIEATIRSPLILMFMVLGSALTVFFWSKWIGRIQTSSYHPKFKGEELAPGMKFALLTLATGVLVTGFGSIWIFNTFFAPIAKAVFADIDTIPLQLWQVFEATGSFPAITFSVVLLTVFVIYWLTVWRRFSENDVRLPYLCGENAESSVFNTSAFNNSEGTRSYAFRSVGDKIEDSWCSTTYLKGYVSEQKATVWLNLTAWLVIIILLGETKLLW